MSMSRWSLVRPGASSAGYRSLSALQHTCVILYVRFKVKLRLLWIGQKCFQVAVVRITYH
jgi:hypothetical protein